MMAMFPTHLEPLRSETFPYPERYAEGVSPLGRICYFDTGQGGAPGASSSGLPPIVLVHALGINLTEWEAIAPALARHTRVIGLDLPGCGRSAKPRARYSLKIMSQAVLGLLDYLGVRRAILVGHSYGGLVCTDVTLNHPDRVAGLCLMNASGFSRWPKLFHLLAPAVFEPRVMAPVIQRGVRLVLDGIFSTKNEHTERFIRSVLERPDPRFAWDFAYYAQPMVRDLMSNVLDRIDELRLPVLVIWGTDDKLLRYRDVGSWVRRLRDARLVTIPNCGHMPNLEHPDIVNRALIDFLERFQPVRAAQARAG